MIAIVDYGMGNLASAQKGLEKAGHEAVITEDIGAIRDADAVVLPGVGAYADCYRGLAAKGLVDVVKDAAASGRPFLGICVGLQLLFDGSEEGPCDEGLGLFSGRVVRFPDAQATGLKVPHMGWNRIRQAPGAVCPLLDASDPEPYVYFVHSYHARPADPDVVLATCDYGVTFPAIVGRGNVFAVQFHPEKSQVAGLAMLRAFGNLVRERV
jgi:glutamine amidotransferase